MSGEQGFSPRVVSALGGLLLVALAASLLLSGGGEPDAADAEGASSFSRSAIGHLALYETLKELGRTVVRATRNPLDQLGRKGVLILAEPASAAFDATLKAKLSSAKRVVLILPKRYGFSDPDHVGWIREAIAAPDSDSEASLFALDPQAAVVRREMSALTINALGAAPTVVGGVQLAKSAVLQTQVGNADGALLSLFAQDDRKVFVLADPDPVENHGLAKGDNEAFALALFDAAAGGPGARFVFDETIHGFASSGDAASPLARMLRFPGDILALLAAAAGALLVAATLGRFGPPLPTPRPLRAGKRALVDSIASLIDFGGHHGATLRKYVEATLRDGALLMKAPAGRGDPSRLEELDRLSKARGAKRVPSEIMARARAAGGRDYAALLSAAQDAHAWKQEIAHGAR